MLLLLLLLLFDSTEFVGLVEEFIFLTLSIAARPSFPSIMAVFESFIISELFLSFLISESGNSNLLVISVLTATSAVSSSSSSILGSILSSTNSISFTTGF